MANWAITSYAIEGPEETLQKIEQAILHHDVEEGSSEDWEGNVLKALGIKWLDRSQDRTNGKYLRGFIRSDVEPWYDDLGALRFDAEEAWGVTDFDEILEENYPNIKVFWVTEEPDMEVYQTNDDKGKYFKDRYYLDICINGEYSSEYFITEEDAFKWLKRQTEGKVKTFEDIEDFNEEHEDDLEDNFIYFHEYKIITS